MRINYKDRSYLDRIEITPQEVYDRLEVEIPTTSTPSMKQVDDTFMKISDLGFTHVICINISSKLSSTIDLVATVSKSYKELTTKIIDTLNIGFGSAFSVRHACSLLTKGCSFGEIVSDTERMVPRTHTFFITDTLDYLYKGGRIGKTVHALGSILNIKPIITCNRVGEYVVAAKARGKKAAINKAKDLIEKLTNGRPFRLAIANGNAEAEAQRELDAVKRDFPNALEIINGGQISPVLAVHTGPGMIGLSAQLI